MKKKILSMLLTAALLLTCVPLRAMPEVQAATEYVEGDYTYTVWQGEATITDYSGNAAELVIPATLGGYQVTAIGDDAFRGCTSLILVTIPDRVIIIGSSAFDGCTRLATVFIGNNVTTIGSFAFDLCTSLASVTIPDSVITIEAFAFYYCTNLTSVTIGDNIASIGYEAFSQCTSLTSIAIPDSVTSIGDCAFYGCDSLASVYYCGTSEQWNNITFGSMNNCLTNAPRSYHTWAPATCTAPATCSLCGGTNGEALGHSYTDGVCTVCGAYEPGDFTFAITDGKAIITKYTGTATELVIPATLGGCPVTAIGENAFRGCDMLTAVVVPDGVTSIGKYAFRDCTMLTSVTIPDSVTTLGRGAFEGCTALTTMRLPNGLTSVTNSLFFGCTGLTSIVIPDSVTEVQWGAFYNCSALASVTVPAGVTYMDKNAYYGCPALVLYGYADTYTQSFARDFGYAFSAIEEIVIGDMDGVDGLTADDAVYLLYHTLLPEQYPLSQDGDVDGNGTVNSNDAIHLLYHILLPELYPLG